MRGRVCDIELFEHRHLEKLRFGRKIPPRFAGNLIVMNPVPHLQMRRQRLWSQAIRASYDCEQEPVSGIRSCFVHRAGNSRQALDAGSASP